MTKGKKSVQVPAPAPKVQKKTVEVQIEEHIPEPATSPSTSSSTSSDSLSLTNVVGQEEEDEAVDIFDLLCGSDAESGEEEQATAPELEYLQRKTLEEKPDFFVTFTGVPSMDDISEDISVMASPTEDKKRTKSQSKKDVGRFVNPITGEVLDDDDKSDSETSAMEEVEEEEEGVSEEPMDVSELSDLSLPASISDVEEPEEKDVEDTLVTFLELEKEPVEAETTEIDFEAMWLEEENRRVLNNTLEFITDLINKVVEIVEYVSPEKLLEQNLDKHKLLKEISEVLPTLNVERRCCEFLNRQISTYFKHRISHRNTTNISAKTIALDKLKFERARERLDNVLAEEKKLLNSSTELRDGLRQQYNDLKKHVDNLVDNFENLVRKNLSRDNRPKLNMLMEQLEDLGNGLTVKEFNNLQAETQALDKKIEERNNELNKLYARCRNDLHALSHYKEKEQMATDSITIQKATLNDLTRKKRNLREYVFNLKKERSLLNSEIKRLSAQCGILDKPALMMDYDDTVEHCEEQQALNDYLKRTLATIERKLQNLLKQNDCHVNM
ncbi:hypothetical protein DOY81_005070 [Sarcophaga bullata]|nr:hypothetical protein DOY81_005070 [Sarcophaga bullata]